MTDADVVMALSHRYFWQLLLIGAALIAGSMYLAWCLGYAAGEEDCRAEQRRVAMGVERCERAGVAHYPSWHITEKKGEKR